MNVTLSSAYESKLMLEQEKTPKYLLYFDLALVCERDSSFAVVTLSLEITKEG